MENYGFAFFIPIEMNRHVHCIKKQTKIIQKGVLLSCGGEFIGTGVMQENIAEQNTHCYDTIWKIHKSYCSGNALDEPQRIYGKTVDLLCYYYIS